MDVLYLLILVCINFAVFKPIPEVSGQAVEA